MLLIFIYKKYIKSKYILTGSLYHLILTLYGVVRCKSVYVSVLLY